MYISHVRGWFGPFYEIPGDGSGGGAPAPGAGGTPDNSPIKFSDLEGRDIDWGDGKPVKFKDSFSTRYVPKAEADSLTERFNAGRDLLLKEAEKLEQAWQRFDAGRGPQPNQARPQFQDIMARVSKMPVVNGEALKELHDAGYGQLATALVQQQAIIKKLQEQVTGFETTQRTIHEDHTNRRFDSEITSHLTNVGEVKGLNGLLGEHAQDPTLREIAKDLWLSHDQASWKPDEFRQLLASRLSGLVALVRKMDKAYTEKKREEGRQRFFKPAAGNGQANGEPGPYEHKNGAQLAKQFFAGRAQAANE